MTAAEEEAEVGAEAGAEAAAEEEAEVGAEAGAEAAAAVADAVASHFNVSASSFASPFHVNIAPTPELVLVGPPTETVVRSSSRASSSCSSSGRPSDAGVSGPPVSAATAASRFSRASPKYTAYDVSNPFRPFVVTISPSLAGLFHPMELVTAKERRRACGGRSEGTTGRRAFSTQAYKQRTQTITAIATTSV